MSASFAHFNSWGNFKRNLEFRTLFSVYTPGSTFGSFFVFYIQYMYVIMKHDNTMKLNLLLTRLFYKNSFVRATGLKFAQNVRTTY